MKVKWLSWLCIGVMLMIGAGVAEPVEAELVGRVVEINADGSFVMTTLDHGDVLVHVNEQTTWVGVEHVYPSRYVTVSYDGIMTRSIPAQITAQRVTSFTLIGTILSVDDEGALITSEAWERLYVHWPLTEKSADTLKADPYQPGDRLRVYYDGIVATSLPGQINAFAVERMYVVSGKVEEISEDHLMILSANGQRLRAQYYEGTVLPVDVLDVGCTVEVDYNGMMTRAIPAQITAERIMVMTVR